MACTGKENAFKGAAAANAPAPKVEVLNCMNIAKETAKEETMRKSSQFITYVTINKPIRATLLYSRTSKAVMCMEAGKDLVDLLMGFLTLPIGAVVKLLAEGNILKHEPIPPPSMAAALAMAEAASGIPNGSSKASFLSNKDKNAILAPLTAVGSIYESVINMDKQRMCQEKSLLLNPLPGTDFNGKLFNIEVDFGPPPERVVTYYNCGKECPYISTIEATRCPKHRRQMVVLCKILEDMDAAAQAEAEAAQLALILGPPPYPEGKPICSICPHIKTPEKPGAGGCQHPAAIKKSLCPVAAENGGKNCNNYIPRLTGKNGVFQKQLPGEPIVPTANIMAENDEFPVGYVKDGSSFIITNCLEIFVNSAIKSFMHLHMKERVSDLDHIDILIGKEEVYLLTKCSVVGNALRTSTRFGHCECEPPSSESVLTKIHLPNSNRFCRF